MKSLLFAVAVLILCVCATEAWAQNVVQSALMLRGKVMDEDSAAIANVRVFATALTITSGTTGKRTGGASNKQGEFIIKNLTPGRYAVSVACIGFRDFTDTVEVKGDGNTTLMIVLKSISSSKGDEIVVSATRLARAISDVPVRMEVIPAEELDESITMGLGSAKMVLGELPGLMAQGTGSALGAATMRIHGLDGRYTQILVDGIPAFGGLNMNFSVLQLPPLNLRQLEIIKGAAAGVQSDAIGGIINFLTKIPRSETPEGTLVASYTSLGAFDVAGWYGQMFDNLGVSLHVTSNNQPRRDIDGDGYVDVPLQRRFHVNPKLTYQFSPDANLTVAANYISEDRLGGLMAAPEDFSQGNAALFSAAAKTRRIDGMAAFEAKLDEQNSLSVNLSAVQTGRDSYRQLVPFNGTENIFYADAHWASDWTKRGTPFQALVGVSAQRQQFREDSFDQFTGKRDFTFTTLSAFAQGEYKFSSLFTALGFVRLDQHNQYGAVLVPRMSLMFRPDDHLTFRASAGTGWRAPTIFDEVAEERGFYHVSPLTLTQRENASSLSLNGKYKAVVDEWLFSADVNVFYTQVRDRAQLQFSGLPTSMWVNTGEKLTSQGAEFILQAQQDEFDVIFGYTYNDVSESNGGISITKLFTPTHFINAAVLWSIPDVVRLVSDFMLQSPQQLPTNPYATTSPTVTTWGGSVEVWLTHSVSVFVNVENLLDTRQTRTMPLYLGTPGRDNFNGNFVWGPTEGRVFNVGLKAKL